MVPQFRLKTSIRESNTHFGANNSTSQANLNMKGSHNRHSPSSSMIYSPQKDSIVEPLESGQPSIRKRYTSYKTSVYDKGSDSKHIGKKFMNMKTAHYNNDDKEDDPGYSANPYGPIKGLNTKSK